ncbi:MAG: DNA-directed RNA polymerase subunit alpha [Patescibacteria group bacterium]
MKNISLPKKFLVEESEKGKKAKVTIEPCFPGYGLTLGNALRRVMLSSLPGGAVTAVKIKGVSHEFSTLPGVSEDVMEMILNLKQLRVKVEVDEPVVLRLKVKGEKEVTGADIESSSDAEVINKNLFIASINGPDGELDMELTVKKGIGYESVEEKEEKSQETKEIGVIAMDSLFSPVTNVGLNVEATRVGEKVDYDRIILDIETDGTISPEEAVQKAAEILVNQFSWIVEGGREEIQEVDIEAPVIIPEKPEEEIAPAEEAPAASEEIEEKKEEAEPKPRKRGRPRKTEE